MKHVCRHCGASLDHQVIDLGHQPPSNAYLEADQLSMPELTYPLKLLVCTHCWLVQLPAHASAESLFTADYAYLSSTSTTWCEHAKHLVYKAVDRLSLGPSSHVVEIASNDGYLLQYVCELGISCLGIEPTHAAAEVARSKGIPTLENFFGFSIAHSLDPADLIVANNVLAHVPDINDFVKGVAVLLKRNGLASIECPHVLNLVQKNQFDTIYHEHYSYLSLHVVERLASFAGLVVVDVEELSTHGGSLRYWLAHQSSCYQTTPAVASIRALEKAAGLETLEVWHDFESRAQKVKNNLLGFLIEQYETGSTVMGYGAAAKGNTLLNYAGVRKDLLPVVADRAPGKQGRYLPGSHIPIISPESLARCEPDTLLVLPWNLINEVKRDWHECILVTAIPEILIYPAVKDY